MSGGGSRAVGAGVADGQEDGLPASGGVAPVVRLQDERALGAISDHEAVDDVVELAAITTALIDVTHQLPRLTAVWGVLGGGEQGTFQRFFYCLTFVLDLSKPYSLTCNNTWLILFSLFPLSVCLILHFTPILHLFTLFLGLPVSFPLLSV